MAPDEAGVKIIASDGIGRPLGRERVGMVMK